MAKRNNPVTLTDKEIKALSDLFNVACNDNPRLNSADLQRAMDKIYRSQTVEQKRKKKNG